MAARAVDAKGYYPVQSEPRKTAATFDVHKLLRPATRYVRPRNAETATGWLWPISAETSILGRFACFGRARSCGLDDISPSRPGYHVHPRDSFQLLWAPVGCKHQRLAAGGASHEVAQQPMGPRTLNDLGEDAPPTRRHSRQVNSKGPHLLLVQRGSPESCSQKSDRLAGILPHPIELCSTRSNLIVSLSY